MNNSEIKDCRVAWIPKKSHHLTAEGVKAIGGYFIKSWFTYDRAGMIASQLSLETNQNQGDYIAVYSVSECE